MAVSKFATSLMSNQFERNEMIHSVGSLEKKGSLSVAIVLDSHYYKIAVWSAVSLK